VQVGSIFKVVSTMLDIKIMKKDWIRWSALEGNLSLDLLNKASDEALIEKKIELKATVTSAKKAVPICLGYHYTTMVVV